MCIWSYFYVNLHDIINISIINGYLIKMFTFLILSEAA